jgi:hypothetical protein
LKKKRRDQRPLPVVPVPVVPLPLVPEGLVPVPEEVPTPLPVGLPVVPEVPERVVLPRLVPVPELVPVPGLVVSLPFQPESGLEPCHPSPVPVPLLRVPLPVPLLVPVESFWLPRLPFPVAAPVEPADAPEVPVVLPLVEPIPSAKAPALSASTKAAPNNFFMVTSFGFAKKELQWGSHFSRSLQGKGRVFHYSAGTASPYQR